MHIRSQNYSIKGYASSLVGGRPENQDEMGWIETPLGFLLVVCDGMGGGPGGRTASSIAASVFMQTMYDSSPQASPYDAIKMAVSRANDSLDKKMEEIPTLRGMGSTIVAILINKQSAIVAHLGDSRCYRIHGSRMIFRTHDHSLVSELVDAKALTEEEARVSPQSNVITRGLGNTSNHVAEIEEVPYQKGDRFILCTDGVWGIMPHNELLQRFGAPVDLVSLVDNLQSEIDRIGASTNQHHDNHTIAIIEIDENSKKKDSMNKFVKGIIGTLGGLLLLTWFINGILFYQQKKVISLLSNDKVKSEKCIDSLQKVISMINEIKDEGIESIITEKIELEQKVRNLEIEVRQQAKSLDSLEKNNMRPAIFVSKKDKEKTEKSNVQIAPAELVDNIIRLIQEINETKGNDIKIVINSLKETTNKIRQDIKELDRITNGKYKSKIEGILRLVPDEKEIEQHISKDKIYYPNDFITRPYKKVKDELNKIKNDLIK